MSGPRLLVVVKTSSYRAYVEEQRDPRTVALLAKKDPTVRRLLASHEAHEATRREVMEAVDKLGVTARYVAAVGAKVDMSEKGQVDLVVTVGGDGTLLAASHEVGAETPILGINSAPSHSVGFFCGAEQGGVAAALADALAGTMRATVLSRMQVTLNGTCLCRRVLNDALFCHEIPAATSRYIVTVEHQNGRAQAEEQKSSGLWIGPAAGSTAAQHSAGGRVLPLASRRIQYVVREPYSPIHLQRGTLAEGGRVVLQSKMRAARVFLDGPHLAHEAGLGDVVTLERSAEPLTVLGLSRDRRARLRREPSPA